MNAKFLILFSLLFTFFACSEKPTENTDNKAFTDNETKLFSKIPSEQSQIKFKNLIQENLEFNFLNYPYMYTGGGVAVGDFNKDGREDVYLVSNMGSNKLYFNTGDFTFEDVTERSNTQDTGGFSTGATIMDVNDDGWLDIYVSKAGSLTNDEGRRNKLYVNQKDGTFKDEAMLWGLDDPGYTTQVCQLDYDKDGDLDLYVINYRYDFKNNGKISGEIQSQIEEITSDQLYRNEGNRFTKVTAQAGVRNKTWGLGAAVGDFNNDGWDDIYVANDFLEPDFLYINQKNGTFRNEINQRFKHISFNSMGADLADLNNDLMPDLLTLDMMAENYARSKVNMASMSTENFMSMVKVGYHHAYMANMLHFNHGNGTFQETGQLSGITKTDWSWAPLLADFDNDGLKDIFVSNGVYRDYHNQDFRNQLKEKNARGESMTLQAVIEMMPSEKLDNYVFKNNGDLTFTKVIEDWGLNDPTFSNGASYADFDNDGDLDLIVNNVNDEISLYRNNSNQNFIQVELVGPMTNSLGIGTSIYVKDQDKTQLQEMYVSRGFESSVTPIASFGLGTVKKVEQLMIEWPDGRTTIIENPTINTKHTINHNSATNAPLVIDRSVRHKQSKPATDLGLEYVHKENTFNDFDIQLLIPQKQSSKGTGIAKADVNGDGLEDLFVGNASNAPAALYVQQADGTFQSIQKNLWKKEAAYEDADALFFDSDGDGDQDLYVVSAGYELSADSALLQDRLYINDGKGNFSKNTSALPKMLSSGKSVTAADIDGDGDLDLFAGGNVLPKQYPLASASYLLQNENGKFKDITPNNADLQSPGMVTQAIFTDYDGDNDQDLLLTGEWMKPTFYDNNKGSFTKKEIEAFDKKEGWWFSATANDMDGDGDIDYFFGNLGDNNKFHPSEKKPLFIYAKDFDNNGSFDVALSKINDGRVVPVRGKECSSEQNPFLLEKIQSYKEFASLDMESIYGKEELQEAEKRTLYTFKSVYAQNNGDGTFTLTELPNEAQLGPTMSFLTKDFNGDGNLDVMGVGGIYDAEVETIRYDGNYGYILLGNKSGTFTYSKEYDPFVYSDAKDIVEISIQQKPHFIVASNNAPLEVFTFQP